jgi:hypothetical protein
MERFLGVWNWFQFLSVVNARWLLKCFLNGSWGYFFVKFGE